MYFLLYKFKFNLIKVKSLNELWRNFDDINELEEKLVQIYIDIVI